MMPFDKREVVCLTDGVISMRPVRIEDAEAWIEAVNESLPDLQPWMPFAQQEPSPEDVHQWLVAQPTSWAKARNYAFAILEAQSQALLGSCLLNNMNLAYRMANVVYWVRSSARGRGVAGRAVRLIARFGFQELSLLRLEIVIAVENKASQRAAEKAGAHREGVLRNRILVGERLHQAVMYSLIPDDLL